jgi:hypothetical protein
MGAILPVKQHGERLLSGMAQKPPDDRLGSIVLKNSLRLGLRPDSLSPGDRRFGR